MATNPYGPPAGLLGLLLGANNPVSQFTAQNRGALGGLGTSLLSSGMNFSPMQAGMALDQRAAEERSVKAQSAEQQNATRALLAKEAPDLAQLLDTGVPMGEVWGEYFRRKSPGKADNPYMSAGDGTFFNWQTGEYVTDPNAAPKMPDAPSGYRWGPDGSGLEFIPGGPHDPANAGVKPPTDADVRAAKLAGVIQGDKELLLGPNGIYDKLADPWSQAVGAEVGVGGIGVGRPGLALTAPDYQSATNALTNIAQSYLYAISGQAAPAGEVAKIIESVTPKFGEDASSVKNKKARLASYIAAIEASKYDVPTGGGAGGGDAEIEGILTGLGI
jgi:hypothetical protein